MLVARDSPVAAAPDSAPPPYPPGFNHEIYLVVPLFNRRADLLALTISFMVFSCICSVLRLYYRFVVLRAPGWDDLFVVLALLCTNVCSILLCIAPDYGFGKSMYVLTLPETERLMKIMYVGNFPYPLSVTFIKIALLFQYLRIFEADSKRILICKCLIFIIAIWGMIFAIFTWLPCIPLDAFWDFSLIDAKCWGFGSRHLSEFMHYFVSQAITTSIFDLVIFILPAHLYFQPGAQKKTRIALLCLFAMGLAVILLTLWRMAYVIQMERAGAGSFDPTWYSPTAAGLANLEIHLAVACAALPVFWPGLERTWNKIFVTCEVSVTTEHGQFFPRSNDIEMQSMSSDKDLTFDAAQMPEGWEPFVGDETSGLGESETVIESLTAAAQSKKGK
ncbi:hypothetical protein B0H63DRAFT_464238 [Podospora didyma]|uniref:Rhodopsin domain-containing protein n=1 Tax=Podospora didyma TaxID=330526 RepID=A0AAE0NY07_9PEZI|nr:hypothetical protein B0H63DRAFT_464238 [Podospora didyma]